MEFDCTVGRLFRLHLAAIGVLALLNIIPIMGDAFGHNSIFGFSSLLRLADEGNIPTMFAALALGATAIAAAAISVRCEASDADRKTWRLIAILFAFMAVDEAVRLHEMLNRVGQHFRLGGVVLHVGVFPYVVLAAVLAISMWRFWLRQSAEVRSGIMLGGIIYSLSAFLPELPENLLQSRGVALTDLRMSALHTIEELGEMLGVALILRAFLLRYVQFPDRPLLIFRVRPDEVSEDGGLPKAPVGGGELPRT